MAVPTDPPKPAGTGAFANARLTLEDAERLAATFRPSWELDEAPFTGAASFSDADLRALKSASTQADVRGAVQALNGTHAPVPATVLHEEPTSSVIIEGAVEAEPPVAAAPAAAQAPRAPMTKTGTLVLPHFQGAIMPQRTVVMATAPGAAVPMAAMRGRAASIDLGDVDFANRSKAPLWIAVGGALLALVGVGVWLASSSADKSQSAPAPTAETAKPTASSRIPAPPPVAETVTAQPPAPAPPPPAAAPPPQPQAPAVAAAPPAPPPPRLVVPPAPRPPTWTPSASPPRAPARPKPGQTIVRDVPF